MLTTTGRWTSDVVCIKEQQAALATALQALAEMDHAHAEPDWFTQGKGGADAPFRLWRRRGVDAVTAALRKWQPS